VPAGRVRGDAEPRYAEPATMARDGRTHTTAVRRREGRRAARNNDEGPDMNAGPRSVVVVVGR